MLNYLKRFYFGTLSRIKRAKRIDQLLILISFLITFILARIITNLQRISVLPQRHLYQHGSMAVHHLVPGIIFLLISGYIGLSFSSNRKIRAFMSILFGIGAALTIDEFALWLYLKDVYWERQGRTSVDAVIIFAVLLTIAFLIGEARERYKSRKKRKLTLQDNKNDLEENSQP